MHDIPLNDTQRFFAEKNHNLVYKFLHEKNLPASEYYDIIIFGYLRAVQRYLTDPNLAGYSFATVAWRAMEGEIVNAHRTARRRFRVIRFVRPRQTYTGHGLSTDALFVDNEVNKGGNRLENYARALERSKRMMQIIDTAIDLMRRKHKKGEFYYWILYYAYLSPQQCENAGAILQSLESKGISISLRTYYVHRDEAIEVLSSILWGYTSQDCEKITNLLTPD